MKIIIDKIKVKMDGAISRGWFAKIFKRPYISLGILLLLMGLNTGLVQFIGFLAFIINETFLGCVFTLVSFLIWVFLMWFFILVCYFIEKKYPLE